MSVIDRGVAVGYFHVSPALQRREHHKQVGGAVAFVFVIEALDAAFGHRDRHAGFLDELLAGFVKTDQRTFGIARTRVNHQHILHRGYERTVLFRRDNPLFFEMGLKRVFLEPSRPCCGSYDRRCAVQPLCLPANAASSLHVPWAVPNRPVGSTALLSRRQRSVRPAASPVSCGSKPLPPLLRRTVVSPARTCLLRFPKLPQSARPSNPTRP